MPTLKRASDRETTPGVSITSKALALGLMAALAAVNATSEGAELILPQGRTAYYSDEAIELAIAGLQRGQKAAIALVPQGSGAGSTPVEFNVEGDGSTVTVELAPRTLASGVYLPSLDGKPAGARFSVSARVNDSTMLISQTIALDQVRKTGGNFFLGNAFQFGLIDSKGLPEKDLRGRMGGLGVFDRAVAADLPTVVYMYWTGYVTHKPWGTRKGWAEPTVSATMRLFNLHVAQRLRRFRRNIQSIGTIDEPGLGQGKTPAGSWASGFANWDSAPWYEHRGWVFTNDPAARDDDNWRRYGYIRGSIIGAQQEQAHRDLKRVWPDVVFSTDNYAAFAVMDGADPMNQRTNDIPATHVFLDWGTGRLGAQSGLYIEKSHDPTALLSVATNGQLMGGPMPSAVQQVCYRGMLNSMLAAGLRSNWWLNWGAITPDDLQTVNEPVRRIGPLFVEMRPNAHDVAILWSQTEVLMRCKEIVARSAHEKAGVPLLRTVARLPENSAEKGPVAMEISTNGVGGNYRDSVQAAHLALNRAGYPAHVLHERILPTGILKDYRVLVIVGQTAAPPRESLQAIADFVAAGGQVVVDRTTTIALPGALLTEADFRDLAYRWTPLLLLSERSPGRFKTPREASYYQTNHFMDEPARAAVAPMKAVLARTRARPIFTTDSVHLMGERHTGGEGMLYMVINAHDRLPEIPEKERFMIWNYAPYTARFTLAGIEPGRAVYEIEGTDWRSVRRLADVQRPQREDFAAGEMKLYLVAPRDPAGLELTCRFQEGALAVECKLQNLKMPWPLHVLLRRPDGTELFRVYRSTDAGGRYIEAFSIGDNAPSGTYAVEVSSPVANLKANARALVGRSRPRARTITGPVRVFDADAIRAFLRGKPELAIAVAGDRYRRQAGTLADALRARGLSALLAEERSLFHRHRYPRVFDPYIKVYMPSGPENRPSDLAVEKQVRLQIEDGGRVSAVTPEGTDLGEGWRQQAHLLATVTGKGFIDYEAADGEEMYEPSCQIYIDGNKQWKVVRGQRTEIKATPEARQHWSRPWTRLSSFVGGFNLTPQLPEAYACDRHLVLLGDSSTSELVAALQASELLPQVADAKYPGPGKALLSFAWSPFGLEKDVVLIGASDGEGIKAGVDALIALAAGALAAKGT